MRVLIAGLFVTLCAASTSKGDTATPQGSLDSLESCPEYSNVLDYYHDSLYNFTIEIFKHAALRSNFQFAITPHSLWMTLAGVAEGADPFNQQQLFQFLSLPNDPCLRRKYYQLAASRISSSTDVKLDSKRTLVIDEKVTINSKWHNYVTENSLLEVVSAPIKRDPAAAANTIRYMMSAKFPELNLEGNSVLLDTIDYNGLWTTAFSEATTKRAPFYNTAGQPIGAVDLMRVKLQAKIGYLPSLQSKLLELPVGKNSQYRMILAVVVGEVDLLPILFDMKGSVVSEAIAALKDSVVPIEVALPRFSMNSEVNATTLLQDLGLTHLWSDAAATRYISDPPALPSSYVQRCTVTFNNDGVNPPPPAETLPHGPSSEPSDAFWSEFIADRPFMFGLYDAETYSCLIASMYTQPTYSN